MSTDSDRRHSELQFSVEEYRELWEVQLGLQQDRRHVWVFLNTVLLGVPAAAAAFAGKEGLQKTFETHAHAVAVFLTVLAFVGFLGFVHLVYLRKQMVEYTREINRIRGFWADRGVVLARPSKLLHTCDEKPLFWEPMGGNAWFAWSIVVIVSFVFGLACFAWTRFAHSGPAIFAFFWSLLFLWVLYRQLMQAFELDYRTWRDGGAEGEGWRSSTLRHIPRGWRIAMLTMGVLLALLAAYSIARGCTP